MFELSSIFVGVDFSRGGASALKQARAIAGQANADLHLVHVVPPMMQYVRRAFFPYAGMGEDELLVRQYLVKEAKRSLRDYLKLKKEKSPDRVPWSLDVLQAEEVGVQGDTLVTHLNQANAELVVVGSSGTENRAPGSLGSFLASLVGGSTRPVWVTHRVEPPKRARRVAVMLDLSPASLQVYQTALALALTWDVPLDVVMVIPDPRTCDVAGVLRSAIKVESKTLIGRGRKELNRKMVQIRDQVEVPFPLKERQKSMKETLHVLSGDPVLEMNKFVQKTNVSLLVIGRQGGHSRNGHAQWAGRTTRAILSSAPCHMLVVPT